MVSGSITKWRSHFATGGGGVDDTEVVPPGENGADDTEVVPPGGERGG